jgi:hypothetical protein
VLDLFELPDDSIIVAGHTDSFGTQTGDAWWIHLDGGGVVLGERVYGNVLPGGAADIVIDPDGGMAVVGAHTPDIFTDRDAWAHHVDATGAIDWQWEFDADPGMHSFFAVAATTGGGYIATGSTALSSTVPIYAWVVKLDSAGNVTWQQRYNGGEGEHANFVVPTVDGGYAIAGWTTSSGAGITDVWLLKINSTGVIEWQKTYGGIDQEEATGLIQTADGGYALSAFTNTFPASGHGAWVLRLDSMGNVLWHAVMGDEWGDFRNIVQTDDGDLIATGRISGPSSNDLWVVKFQDSDGAVLWQRAYEGTQGDWGSQTMELADADLLIGGIWAWGFAEEDIWLQRTDSTGLISACPLIRDTAVMTTAPRITVQDGITVASNPAPIAVAITFAPAMSTLTVDEKCATATGIDNFGSIGTPVELVSVAPNPIRTSATITFRLEESTQVRIDIFDVGGRRLHTIAEETYPAGNSQVRWEATQQRELPSGVYYLALVMEGEIVTRRAIILR